MLPAPGAARAPRQGDGGHRCRMLVPPSSFTRRNLPGTGAQSRLLPPPSSLFPPVHLFAALNPNQLQGSRSPMHTREGGTETATVRGDIWEGSNPDSAHEIVA